MSRALRIALLLLASIAPAAHADDCDGLGLAISNAFLESMGKLMTVMFSQAEELSDEETMRLTLQYFEESFTGQGFDDFIPGIKEDFSQVGESLTLGVVAAHTQLRCERGAVRSMKSMERQLAWCNSAPSRDGASDTASQFAASYQCAKSVLDEE